MSKKKYYYDLEFIEYPHTIDLISIGVVCEDGREYYAICSEFREIDASEWVKENVISRLDDMCEWKTQILICAELLEFFGDDEVELWGYYSAYDHVGLMWLWGPMINKPDCLPMYTMDIKQLCMSLGNPELPEQGKGEHNALADARWNKLAHEFLIDEGACTEGPG